MVEPGQIDEKEFDAAETRLLEQIEGLAKLLHPHNESENR